MTSVLVFAVALFVDLTPSVESDFFFSEDDPQLQESLALEARFPGGDLVVVRVEAPDLESPAYEDRVEALSTTLGSVPGVTGVYSIASENEASPLWSRVLLPDDGATNVVLQVDSVSEDAFTTQLEGALAAHGGPDFGLVASGVPVIVELIRRSLRRDLLVFSTAALLLFGLVATLIYRNARLVAGTLTACISACALTLILNSLIGIRVGLLTANIITIVFVLTLSHTVFLVANWKQGAAAATSPEAAAVEAAVKTLKPSLWAMLTTVLGFASLWLTSAEPLRELGTAGMVGTVVALIAAYAVLPAWLIGAQYLASPEKRVLRLPSLAKAWLVVLAVAVGAAGLGLSQLDTDPSLLSYFSDRGAIRPGLESIDRSGGSSPLLLAVTAADGSTLDTREAYDRLWVLQDSLEADPAVGVVLSPAPLLAHARQQPLAGFLPLPALITILERPEFGNLIQGFLLPDRTEALYSIRMVEADRAVPRENVVQRLRAHAEPAGLRVTSIGGLYELQGRLGDLILSSLRIGLGGLLVLFFGIALLVSRHGLTSLAMLACLAAIPAVVLGVFGHLGVAVDIITSPAANVALAMGVDSMIHLVNRVRELGHGPTLAGSPWLEARDQLAGPILTACAVICVGFGIFALSDFPPTQRFGFAVILGTLSAAAAAAFVLPSIMRGNPGDPKVN
ncbi:MAG: efflux RND transporter permease subunit [Longimicrobiales bacterium]